MRSFTSFALTAAYLLSPVSASSQSTADLAISELAAVRNYTDSLTAQISSWDGTNVTVAVAINTASMNLVSYLQNATAMLKAVPTTFNTVESFNVGAPTQNLAYSVNASIAALILKKDDFAKNNFLMLVQTSLASQESASNNFSAVLLSYVPSDVRPVADALNGQVTASLNMGIDCFNNMNSSCITAVADKSRTYNAAIKSGAIKKNQFPAP